MQSFYGWNYPSPFFWMTERIYKFIQTGCFIVQTSNNGHSHRFMDISQMIRSFSLNVIILCGDRTKTGTKHVQWRCQIGLFDRMQHTGILADSFSNSGKFVFSAAYHSQFRLYPCNLLYRSFDAMLSVLLWLASFVVATWLLTCRNIPSLQVTPYLAVTSYSKAPTEDIQERSVCKLEQVFAFSDSESCCYKTTL